MMPAPFKMSFRFVIDNFQFHVVWASKTYIEFTSMHLELKTFQRKIWKSYTKGNKQIFYVSLPSLAPDSIQGLYEILKTTATCKGQRRRGSRRGVFLNNISGMIGKPFTEYKTPVLKNRSWTVKLTTDAEEIHNITNVQSLRNCMSISFSS